MREEVDVESFVGEEERKERCWGGGEVCGDVREELGRKAGVEEEGAGWGAGWGTSGNGARGGVLGGAWHCHGWTGSGGMDVGMFGGSRGGAGNNSNFAPEMNRDGDTGAELEVGDGLI